MSQTTVTVIIAVCTFFLTCLVNAFVIGMFMGGMRTEMRLMADRLAKIEGMFTLVPRRGETGEVAKSLSLGLVYLDRLVPYLGILASFQACTALHPIRVHLAT